jgi:hypothetical protein
MRRIGLIVTGAVLAGALAFAPASRADAVVYTTCTGTNGTETINDWGVYWERAMNAKFTTASGSTTCVGTGAVSAAHWNITFVGFFGNCNTLMGKTGSYSLITVYWDAPANMGSTRGVARATVASRTADTTTLTFTGSFNDSAGQLYRNHPFSGTVVFNKSFLPVASGGDCSTTVPLRATGGGTDTTLVVG